MLGAYLSVLLSTYREMGRESQLSYEEYLEDLGDDTT